MKKKIIIIFSLVLLIISVILFIIYPYIKPLKIIYNWEPHKLSTECENTFNFISTKLSREDGAIYTNYLDAPSKGDETRGHDILSESEGLMMLYSLEINDKNLFDKHFNIVDKYMLLDNGLISWRISPDNKKNKTSALIDDLRIFKSLILAYDRFGEYKYRYAATKLSKAILNKSTSEGLPVDFNDSVNKSNTLTLCYIDLETMSLLSKIHGKWDKINTSSKKVLNDGLFSEAIPFFKKSYDINSKTYSSEKETELIYSLICWENKLNNGDDITPIMNWIKNNLITYDALFSKYDNSTGKPADNIESTAIYAVASRLAYKYKDLDLFDKLSSLLINLQIKEKDDKLYGGFGFCPREEVYSYDNLQSLLSLIYIKPLKINYMLESNTLSDNGKPLINFINTKLSRNDGAIYTNYLDKPSHNDETRGHDILSESEGFMMLYSLETNDRALFDKHFKIVDRNMMLENGLISWRISKDNIKNKSSALIDELRIFKALILGYDRFGDYKYRVAALKLSKNILNNSTLNGVPIDFNDSINKSNLLTLCYIDLEAFNLFNQIDDSWKNISEVSKKILNDGLISSTIPFFKKNYDVNSKLYSTEKENELLYSLICWENKKDSGDDISPIVNWIRDNLKTYGGLYSKYDINTGKPVDNVQSTSIYAVASRLAYKTNDLDLYNNLMSVLLKFQVMEPSSSIYGSFGFAPKEEVYSFDNLQGLLSLLKKSDTVKKQ